MVAVDNTILFIIKPVHSAVYVKSDTSRRGYFGSTCKGESREQCCFHLVPHFQECLFHQVLIEFSFQELHGALLF